jgi:hypothetical protein
MFEIGDVIRVKDYAWRLTGNSGEPLSGAICWISPVGDRRVIIKDCGYQFKPDDVEFLWVDVDISNVEENAD